MRGKGFIAALVLVLAGCGSVADEEGESAPSRTGTRDTPTASEENPAVPPATASPATPTGAVEDTTVFPSETGSSNGSMSDSQDDSSDGSEPEMNEAPTVEPEETSSAQDSGAMGLKVASSNPGFLIGDRFTVDGEVYRRLVMPDDYENIVQDSVLSDSDLTIPEEDVIDALLVTGRFAGEELATSELAFDYSEENARAWLEEHADLFVQPDLVEAGLLDTESPNNSLALLYTNNGWDRGVPERVARVQNLHVELADIEQDGQNLTITHSVSFEAKVDGAGGLDGTFVEKTRLTATYEVTQVDGEWKIADYTTSWQTRY